MAFQPEYGLMGAGAVNMSLVARLPRTRRELGPVAAVSFRVASRIANSLGAGVPARNASELDSVRVILFHSSSEQFRTLLHALAVAKISWLGKSLIFCDCQPDSDLTRCLSDKGASIGSLRRSALPGRLVVEGCGPALVTAHRMAKDLRMKVIEITPDSVDAYETAMLLAGGALTPLIDRAGALLRQCGIRDTDASKLAAALFEQTARDYARTGRQSWAWYQRTPDVARVITQLTAADERLRSMLVEVVLFGLDEFGRYPETAREIRAAFGRTTRSEALPPDPDEPL